MNRYMKKEFLLFAAALFLLCSCSPGSLSGSEQTITRGIKTSAGKIVIKGNVDVEINDESNVMTITGDSNLLKLVKVKDGKKVITVTATAGLLRDAASPRVKVTLPFIPMLNYLKMEGTSYFKFGRGDIGPKLTIETKGANHVYSVMAMVDLVIKAEGSDFIEVDCVCDTADIDAKGSCVIGTEKGPIAADNLKIFTFGTSVAYVEAGREAFGAAEEASTIYTRGEHYYGKLKAKDKGRIIPYE